MIMPSQPKPVTAERIEKALDGLAGIIAAAGEAGRVYLPIYVRLERDLADMREDDATMAAALARAKRARGSPPRR